MTLNEDAQLTGSWVRPGLHGWDGCWGQTAVVWPRPGTPLEMNRHSASAGRLCRPCLLTPAAAQPDACAKLACSPRLLLCNFSCPQTEVECRCVESSGYVQVADWGTDPPGPEGGQIRGEVWGAGLIMHGTCASEPWDPVAGAGCWDCCTGRAFQTPTMSLCLPAGRSAAWGCSVPWQATLQAGH